jgi:protein SCO1
MKTSRHNFGWLDMRRIARVALLLRCVLVAAPGSASAASSLTHESLVAIRFDQKVNGRVSPDLTFRDETGKMVRLGDYFGNRPAILVLGYYGCPMLCTLVLNGLVESLQDLKMDVGKQFQVINISIDPKEAPELAAAKKRTYLKRYGRHGAELGWHFLTGQEEPIKRLADEVGFHYAYDPTLQQFAHPSGIIVVTSEGKVARYFFGINFAPRELDAALRQASANHIGSPIKQLMLLCFHYSPLTGKYGHRIMTIVRLSGAATIVGLLAVMVLASQHQWKRRPAQEGGDDSSAPQPENKNGAPA